jgi:hypothetical protein
VPDNPYACIESDPVYRLADYCTRCGKLDKEGAHARYYCPRCHEVTCGMKRHGEYIALPHYRRGPEEGIRGQQKPCVGGPVDPREDRAP